MRKRTDTHILGRDGGSRCAAALFAVAGLVLAAAAGCVGYAGSFREERDGPTVLRLEEGYGRVLRHADFVAGADTVELLTGSCPLSQVLDLCFMDSVVYVLDDAPAVWAFHYPSGRLLRRVCRQGHGHGEYVSARALAAGGGQVYVLDLAGRKVVAYDRQLDYVRSFPIDRMADDFIRTDSGFLFCCIETAGGHRFVRTDSQGHAVEGWLQATVETDFITGADHFSRDGEGRVFFSEPYSNDLYRWDGGTVRLAYRLDFGDRSRRERVEKYSEVALDEHSIHNHQFFVTDGCLVSCFYADRFLHYLFYHPADGSQLQGRPDTSAVLPFAPRWQHGNELVSLYHADDLSRWRAESDSCGAVLCVYRLR